MASFVEGEDIFAISRNKCQPLWNLDDRLVPDEGPVELRYKVSTQSVFEVEGNLMKWEMERERRKGGKKEKVALGSPSSLTGNWPRSARRRARASCCWGEEGYILMA